MYSRNDNVRYVVNIQNRILSSPEVIYNHIAICLTRETIEKCHKRARVFYQRKPVFSLNFLLNYNWSGFFFNLSITPILLTVPFECTL